MFSSYHHQSFSCFLESAECLSPFADHKYGSDIEKLAAYTLGIIPPSLGGDVQDWERDDESDTVVHNMVSTSIVHGSQMPINLSLLAVLLPCSTYDRRRFAAITIRIDNPRYLNLVCSLLHSLLY